MLGIRIVKCLLIIFPCFYLLACSALRHVQYQPSKENIFDPISIIKNTFDRQPEAYNPTQIIELTNEYIKVAEQGSFIILPYQAIKIVFFDNMEKPRISKDLIRDIWWVEIYDKSGTFLFYVYATEENRIKRFVDALHIMMERTSTPD